MKRSRRFRKFLRFAVRSPFRIWTWPAHRVPIAAFFYALANQAS